MRGNKIMALIWIFIAFMLSVVLVIKLTNNPKSKSWLRIGGIHISNISNSFTADLQDTKTFDAKNIKNFDISLSSESLYIQTGSSKNVTVELYCPADMIPSVNLNGNTLKIESVPYKVRINTASCKTVITIPEKMELDTANIRISSGSVHIENLTGSAFKVHGSSGSVHIDDCNFNIFETNSSSGSIHINNCNSDNAGVHSSSGSVHIDNCNFDNLDGSASSGSVRVNGNFDKVDLRSSSGSVSADLKKELEYDSSISSTSGSIRLNLPPKSNFTARYNVTSGSYRNSITSTSGKKGTDVVNGGGINLDLRSTSGSISIN